MHGHCGNDFDEEEIYGPGVSRSSQRIWNEFYGRL